MPQLQLCLRAAGAGQEVLAAPRARPTEPPAAVGGKDRENPSLPCGPAHGHAEAGRVEITESLLFFVP
eukprot:9980371-Lingulodinium_polyedra.AAC.2